jgi:hypothetical protein
MKDNSPNPIFNQWKEAYTFYECDCDSWYEAVYHLLYIDLTEQRYAEAEIMEEGKRATQVEVLKRQPQFFLLLDKDFDRFVGVHGMIWKGHFQSQVDAGKEVNSSYWMDWCGKGEGPEYQNLMKGSFQKGLLSREVVREIARGEAKQVFREWEELHQQWTKDQRT